MPETVPLGTISSRPPCMDVPVTGQCSEQIRQTPGPPPAPHAHFQDEGLASGCHSGAFGPQSVL